MKREIRGELGSEFFDSVNSEFRRVIKVINNDDFITAEQKLKCCVTTYVSGSSGDQNVSRHCY